MKEQRTGAPVFVKVDEYKDILDVLGMIKAKIKEIRSALDAVNKLRKEEDEELAMWSNAINDVDKKVEDIDKMLFEPEQTW